MENEIMNGTEEVLENVEEIIVEEVAAEEPVVEAAETVEEIEVTEEVEEIEEAEELEAIEETKETAKQKLARKCNAVKGACSGTIGRIARDLKETNYNPYFKQTRTYKLEIYRNCNEEEPIDVYETVDEKAFSARAMVAATAASALLMVATQQIVKKILKK